MKHDRDAKLIALLGIVIFIAAALSFIGVKSAEHFVLKSHAQEIAIRWGSVIAESEATPLFGSSAYVKKLRSRVPTMESALMASGIFELSILNRKGELLLQWANINSVSSEEDKYHHHAFWDHLNPAHDPAGQTTLVSATAPLFSGKNYIGDVKVLVDLTGETRHIGSIGNFAFITMLGVLIFISTLGGILVVRNARYRREQSVALTVAVENAQKANASKSTFLANVSHELRSPLNAINGFSEIMANAMFGPLSAKYREYSQDIHLSGEHLLTLINDILDLSKAESGKMELIEEIVDISDLASRIKRLVTERAEKAGVVFRMEITEPFPAIMADGRKLLQVFLNLITNAIKFTPPSGSITLKAEYTPEKGAFFIVKDTGIGVAAEDIAKVLEPFGQINDPRVRHQEGTGLGLPLSKHLVEMHDGRFEFQSEEGVGTTVTVTLPEYRIQKV